MTEITIDHPNVVINGYPLGELLSKVYQQGRTDALQADKDAKVTFIKLHEELKEQGRNISVRTLTSKARKAKIKLFRFDGNRLAVWRKDIAQFVDV